MKKITEKDTPNFLLWTNPYLKEYTKEELVNPDLQEMIVKEDKEADEKWTQEVMKKFGETDKETRLLYLKEYVDKTRGLIDTKYDPVVGIHMEFENKEESNEQ